MQEFYARHGAYVTRRMRDYFADGAWCDHSPDPSTLVCGAAFEPDDPYRRAVGVVEYHEIRTEQAVGKFLDRKQELRDRAHAATHQGPGIVPATPPTKAEVAELTKLQAHARACMADLEAARKALDTVTPNYLKTTPDDVARQQEAQSILADLNAVKL